MRKCDGEPNNESGLYIPYRARLAQTLRTPVAFPSLNNSRIAPAAPSRNYILIIEKETSATLFHGDTLRVQLLRDRLPADTRSPKYEGERTGAR